jgi:hypothetical protein
MLSARQKHVFANAKMSGKMLATHSSKPKYNITIQTAFQNV